MRYFAPLWRASTYARLTYLILGLPLGVGYFAFLATAFSVSASLAIIWVGLPLFVLSVVVWRAFAVFERRLVAALVGVPIEDPPSPTVGRKGLWERTRAILGDPSTWRSLAWLLLRFPLGIAGWVIGTVSLIVTFSLFVLPLVIVTAADMEGSSIDLPGLNPVFWALPAIGVLVVPALAHVVNGWAAFEGSIARSLLGPTARQQRERLQQRTTVLEARTRLAHELHDSVGHTLTMMVVQAGAGRHVFDKDPEFARSALENIEVSGRQALGELDRILGLLREDHDASERAPRPGIDRLPALVDDTRTAGMRIDLSISGDEATVTPEIGRTAYRIVQEGLTNVVKHAAAAPTRVVVAVDGEAVEVSVVNGPPAAGALHNGVAGSGGGRGLAGLRERVAILGGAVEAGPTEEGGYRLWARLPLDGA